ncbi:MAG: sigma-54-dependent Fis family transcriptional regulator [Anaerosolibacter sp.]|jgi:arginine utilization regulatory protein|uniref:sigma-54 interaction domain-containing protein n=1 Tax=Anaerosolibacter sp. TaxID=1872527 RepID=UPI002620C0E4|nr:sigma 54-interacting transcriptional regulator [Anaerosolibacter sp.]MDF2546551.1 sigma-54-dependent Fis family transcriptional regulator [Anaerosolibacter sp.]
MQPYIYEILKIVLQTIDEGVHVIDENGRTMIYNKAMAELEGMDADEVVNKPLLDVFPSLDHESSTLLRVLRTEEKLIDRPQTYLNNHHKEITTINTTVPVYFQDKKVGALEISKNITKIKQLSEQIMTLQLKLSKPDKQEGNKIRKFTFESMIGNSTEFVKAVLYAKKAALSSSSVLIYGETGTGKELVAQSIHYGSHRAGKPFIPQNCAALPESLLEGILFGTSKGGFTGAIDRPGLFEQANGGTIFLDEMNSMGLQLQSKLLRVLQEGYVRRVGGIKDIPIDVRIIASTNQDPYEAIDKGNLRKDLFYRLNVIPIILPPLRERKDDIELLVRWFIKKYNRKLLKNVQNIDPLVLEAFQEYRWPGNVRELENTIEGAMNIIEKEEILEKEHFPPQTNAKIFAHYQKQDSLPSQDLTKTLEKIEKDFILRALKDCNNNISKASEKLGIKRQTLQHKLKRFDIQP